MYFLYFFYRPEKIEIKLKLSVLKTKLSTQLA